MLTAWSLPGKTSRAHGSREASSPLACFRGLAGHGMWGFLPQKVDTVAHPGDWFLPKIHTPQTGLRSILGWLHNKIRGGGKENKKIRLSELPACIRRSLSFAYGLVLLCFGIYHVLASSGTLELILMGTSRQGTAKGGALPKLPGEDGRHQGREHQGYLNREKAQCSDPAFVRQLQMQVCWLRAASRE